MSNQILKAVIHEHIEGSIQPNIAMQLAQKNNKTIPDNFIVKNDAGEFVYNYDTTQFEEFLNAYDTVANLISHAEDYYTITYDYLQSNCAVGMIYSELIISPEHMCKQLQSGDDNLNADIYYNAIAEIERAVADINKIYPVTVRLLAVGVRHLGQDELLKTAKFLQQNPHPMVTGFNIAGGEDYKTFADFQETHVLIDQINLKKSYHAGEIRPASSVDDAIAVGANRIGHGIASINSEHTIATLIEKNIPLEIAITSNVILAQSVGGRVENHPVRKIYNTGVQISLNGDDSGIFGVKSMQCEFDIARSVFAFNDLELMDITICTLQHAFVEQSIKQDLINKVYDSFKKFNYSTDQLQSMINNHNDIVKQRLSQHLTHISN